MSTIKVNAIQNTAGVEQYTCKAWVNFNGTGTVAIRASGNVSSITDNGAGSYTVNFTSALPDTNYATSTTVAWDFPQTNQIVSSCENTALAKTTSAVRILTAYGGDNNFRTFFDYAGVYVSIFR